MFNNKQKEKIEEHRRSIIYYAERLTRNLYRDNENLEVTTAILDGRLQDILDLVRYIKNESQNNNEMRKICTHIYQENLWN